MAVFVPSVRVIVNGTPVDAANTNGPIADLTNRTDWLKDQIDSIAAGSQIVLRGQTAQAGMVVGTPVYLAADNTFKPALAEVDASDFNRAGDRTFWQGFISSISGTVADVVIGGAFTLTTVQWAAVYDTGVFAAGDVYLDAVTAGKITSSPNTSGVYLGHLRSTGEMLVRLGSPDTFLDHVHYERTLVGDPADSAPVDPAINADHTFGTPDTSLRGWLPAADQTDVDNYFPGFTYGVQVPTGTVFGYNITNAAETALNQVFPVIPSDNAQFSQGGLILGDDKVVINQFGIWWQDDSYGNAPWPVDYAVSGVAGDVTLWTTRLIASDAFLDLFLSELTNLLENGLAADYSVTEISSSDPTSLLATGDAADTPGAVRGPVILTPLGVNGLRYRRGLLASGTTGNNTTTGYKQLVDLRFNADLPCSHLYTNVTNVPLNTMAPVSTNGFTSGADASIYGHRLGPDSTDFIDFILTGGRDLVNGTTLVAPQDFEPTVIIHAAVDTAAAAAVAKEVDIDFYRPVVNGPLSSTVLLDTVQATFNTGLPGQLQSAILLPTGSVQLQANQHVIVRIRPSTGGNPLDADTLRVLAVYYGLTEV